MKDDRAVESFTPCVCPSVPYGRHSIKKRGAKPDAGNRLDHLLRCNLGRIVGNLGLSLPKTNVGVIYTVEPFQGSLSDQRSAASRHALDA